jgi:hypothetical protein
MNDVSGPTGLLLIRGLGHSVSTILDLALGAHPNVLGLGEAVRVLDKPLPEESRQGPKYWGELQVQGPKLCCHCDPIP